MSGHGTGRAGGPELFVAGPGTVTWDGRELRWVAEPLPRGWQPPEDLLVGSDLRRMPTGTDCSLHRHGEWVPLESHHIWPLGLGGPDEPTNRARVCANGHYMTHAYMDLLAKHAGEAPWEQARHYGPRVRALARHGWVLAGKPGPGRHGGE